MRRSAAAFSQRWPSTTSPSLRASTGDLEAVLADAAAHGISDDAIPTGIMRVVNELVDRPNLDLKFRRSRCHPAHSFVNWDPRKVLARRQSNRPERITTLTVRETYFLPFWSNREAVDGGTMPLDRRYPTMFP